MSPGIFFRAVCLCHSDPEIEIFKKILFSVRTEDAKQNSRKCNCLSGITLLEDLWTNLFLLSSQVNVASFSWENICEVV